MNRVYECEMEKKKDLMPILEADSLAEDSFARSGYSLKEGKFLEEDEKKCYLYISASDDFIKKADEKLKDIAKPLSGDDEKRIVEKFKKEEEQATSGFGDIFG